MRRPRHLEAQRPVKLLVTANRSAGKSARSRPKHRESALQISIVEWHKRCVLPDQCKLLSIPNGDERPHLAAVRLLEEGMCPGASDLILVLSGGRVVWLETKLNKETGGGRKTYQSDNQRIFQMDVEALQHQYAIVRSIDEYAEFLASKGVKTRVAAMAPAPRLAIRA